MVNNNYILARRLNNKQNSQRKILISFGGSDNFNCTKLVLSRLNQVIEEKYEINVIDGPYYKENYKINEKIKRSNLSINYHENIEILSNFMLSCDFMISGSGSTVWQACTVGIPILYIVTVKNQNLIAQTLYNNKVGIGLELEEIKKDCSKLDKKIQFLLEKKNQQDLQLKSKILTDGNGAYHVANKIFRMTVR